MITSQWLQEEIHRVPNGEKGIEQKSRQNLGRYLAITLSEEEDLHELHRLEAIYLVLKAISNPNHIDDLTEIVRGWLDLMGENAQIILDRLNDFEIWLNFGANVAMLLEMSDGTVFAEFSEHDITDNDVRREWKDRLILAKLIEAVPYCYKNPFIIGLGYIGFQSESK